METDSNQNNDAPPNIAGTPGPSAVGGASSAGIGSVGNATLPSETAPDISPGRRVLIIEAAGLSAAFAELIGMGVREVDFNTVSLAPIPAETLTELHGLLAIIEPEAAAIALAELERRDREPEQPAAPPPSDPPPTEDGTDPTNEEVLAACAKILGTDQPNPPGIAEFLAEQGAAAIDQGNAQIVLDPKPTEPDASKAEPDAILERHVLMAAELQGETIATANPPPIEDDATLQGMADSDLMHRLRLHQIAGANSRARAIELLGERRDSVASVTQPVTDTAERHAGSVTEAMPGEVWDAHQQKFVTPTAA